jgi:hypothetical protein
MKNDYHCVYNVRTNLFRGNSLTKKQWAYITIKVTPETKTELEKLKILPEEHMNTLILRLIDHYKKTKINQK